MTNVPEGDLVAEGALPPEDFHEAIDRVREVAEYDLELPSDLDARLTRAAEEADLLVDPLFVKEAAAALAVGHLVIQGPPGTGKGSLARVLCRAFNVNVLPVTAHDDWTTFEVMGRQELRLSDQGNEETVPVNGCFTEAAIRCAGDIVRHQDHPEDPQATWLLIDELNRAHADRAFGEIFTVLGTDELVEVELPFHREGNRVLITPRRLRVVATLNSIDRQFVNNLGQGLKRRFTFLTLDIPPRRREGEAWGSANADASLASREFTLVLRRIARAVARRLDPDGPGGREAALRADLEAPAGRRLLELLFSFAERVRYAQRETRVPFLPIGTAQLIDTAELFLTRATIAGVDLDGADALLDWAVAVKLAPLFDTDTITVEGLRTFAEGLAAPFDRSTKRELLTIAAAGQYSV